MRITRQSLVEIGGRGNDLEVLLCNVGFDAGKFGFEPCGCTAGFRRAGLLQSTLSTFDPRLVADHGPRYERGAAAGHVSGEGLARSGLRPDEKQVRVHIRDRNARAPFGKDRPRSGQCTHNDPRQHCTTVQRRDHAALIRCGGGSERSDVLHMPRQSKARGFSENDPIAARNVRIIRT